MNIPRVSSVLFLSLAFLLPVIAPSSGLKEQGDREVVFEEIGQFSDGGMAVTVLVDGDLAYVCEFDNGLEILDIRDHRNIRKLCQVPDTAQARGIAVVAGIAFVSCNVNGLKLFNIVDPSRPVYLGRYEASDGDPHQFLTAGATAYLTEWHGGVDIIDIADPRNLRRVSQFKDGGMAFSIQIEPPHAYVTEYKEGTKILDISDSSNPILVGEHNNGGETNALHVTGGKAYVCDKLQGLEILDVTDPARPALLGTFKGGGIVVGVRVVDDFALVINWERGLEAIDVRDPARTSRIGAFFDGGRPNGLQVVGDLVYLADGSDGMGIIKFRKQGKESPR